MTTILLLTLTIVYLLVSYTRYVYASHGKGFSLNRPDRRKRLVDFTGKTVIRFCDLVRFILLLLTFAAVRGRLTDVPPLILIPAIALAALTIDVLLTNLPLRMLTFSPRPLYFVALPFYMVKLTLLFLFSRLAVLIPLLSHPGFKHLRLSLMLVHSKYFYACKLLTPRIAGELLDNLFHMAGLSVNDVFIPRRRLTAFHGDDLTRTARDTVAASPHRIYPVYGRSIDRVTGAVTITEIVRSLASPGKSRRFKNMTEPVYFTPDSQPLLSAMQDMNRNRADLSVVLDEYGGTKGAAVFRSLLYRVFRFTNINDIREKYAVRRLNGGKTYELNPSIKLSDFNLLFNTCIRSDTHFSLAGKIMEIFHGIPRDGTVFRLDHLSLEIISATERHIQKIKVIRNQ